MCSTVGVKDSSARASRKMIRYSKDLWGLLTVTRLYGSAFPRALPFSLFSGVLAGLIQSFANKDFRELWLHPYPYQSFAFIAGFMIVFRCAAGSGGGRAAALAFQLPCSRARRARKGQGAMVGPPVGQKRRCQLLLHADVMVPVLARLAGVHRACCGAPRACRISVQCGHDRSSP